MSTYMDKYDDQRIKSVLKKLADRYDTHHEQARKELIEMGSNILPALMDALQAEAAQTRLEAAKTLGELKAPQAAPALVDLLGDEDTGVRWTAMESLIMLRRTAVKPLLEGLIVHFGSAQFRHSAHHILHELAKVGALTHKENEVVEALKGPASDLQSAWAAEYALEELL